MTRKDQAQKKAQNRWNKEAQRFLTLTAERMAMRVRRMTVVAKLETLQKVARYYGDMGLALTVQRRKRLVVRGY